MIHDFIDLEKHDDGVAVLWLDQQGKSVNTLNPRALEALEEAIEEVERDDSLRAAVLISRKPNNFVAGADLDALTEARTPEEAAAMSRRGHRMIRNVERLRKPVVAAIHGPALGGGLELALACNYRVASEDKPTRFGLPEVQLGLLPGGGGTQLLPRLVGVQEALTMMLTGKNVYPRKAKRIGLVDLLTHRHALLRVAKQAALDLADGSLQPDRDKQALTSKLLELTPIGRRVVYDKALENVRKETKGNYPAPPLIVECVREGMEEGRERGFQLESEYFGRLVFTPQSRALVGLFFAKQQGDKNPFEGAEAVQTLGILGAGLMGAGTAEVSAEKGVEVLLKDMDFATAAQGKKAVWKSLEKKVDRRQISAFERDTILERVTPVEEYGPMGDAQVVIEAVPENLDLKRKVLAAVEAVADDELIFATNTSSIPIAEIAAEADRPERVVGMHYFSPVPKRPLLEVVRKDDTPEEVLATVVDLGLRQGKTVIVVRDGPGFYTTRILGVYLNEALLLLDEGADIEEVDRAMEAWGFPMGPYTLIDFVGIDVAAKVTPVLTERMEGRDLPTSPNAEALLKAGFLGQKNQKGFYRYEEEKGRPKKTQPNPDAYAFFGGPDRKAIDRRSVQERLGL
ncbi:MAG: 3-hydroxyacyl-CoA dehydrogenase NAD-binding domain-containing protein, partial [Rhodothermales bacterium]|nr:3-hydroxyacyl-CoA dehydrogenase NAD-binding domain-containing protein [Rhodothermales bacterium]